MRWVHEEAKINHLARPSYQARQADPRKENEKWMPGVVFREVCTDVLSATKKCCKAYRLMNLPIAVCESPKKAIMRQRVQKLRRKVFVAVVLNKMLKKVREENANAEAMWKQCCAGLASLSMNSKAFASRSLGLKSLRGGAPVCGSISMGLRKLRRGRGAAIAEQYIGEPNEHDALSLDPGARRLASRLPAVARAPSLELQQADDA